MNITWGPFPALDLFGTICLTLTTIFILPTLDHYTVRYHLYRWYALSESAPLSSPMVFSGPKKCTDLCSNLSTWHFSYLGPQWAYHISYCVLGTHTYIGPICPHLQSFTTGYPLPTLGHLVPLFTLDH